MKWLDTILGRIAAGATALAIIVGAISYITGVAETAEAALTGVQMVRYEQLKERIATGGWENLPTEDQARFCEYVARLGLVNEHCR